MDTTAYLKRQGWKGDGFSLDQGGRGIRRPLLVSKKVDVLGVGVNKHAAVSDQWWMRAFDQGLKDLGTGKQSALADVQKHGIHHGSLYARFVKGEGVPGTLGESLTSTATPSAVDSDSSDATTTVKRSRKAEVAAVAPSKLEKAKHRLEKMQKRKVRAQQKLAKATKRKDATKQARWQEKLRSADKKLQRAQQKLVKAKAADKAARKMQKGKS